MSENRICPVCEKDIPEDARFECPLCHLNLIWLDDEIAIQEARQKFTGKLFPVERHIEKEVEEPYVELDSSVKWEHYSVGVLGNFLFGLFIFVVASDGHFYFPAIGFILFLPFGILAGYIGTLLEKESAQTLSQKLGLLFLTIILSVIFSFIVALLITIILFL